MSGLIPRTRICAVCIRRMRAANGIGSSIARPTMNTGVGVSMTRRAAGPSARSIRSFASTSRVTAKKTIVDLSDKKQINMSDFPRERIRNLSIIAHIDHGKSTLADRLLQMTGTVPASANAQFLDKLKVERERGITVKAQTVSIIHEHTDGHKYLINLIDTPGHVDFSYEVSRSIGACEGGLILVDCTRIQAQTLSVFHVALEADLKLLAVINKVDLPHASPEETSDQIEGTLGLDSSEHMYISAKSGLGVEEVLKQIVEGLPGPKKWEVDDGKLRASVFDTHYDHYRGVVALIRVYSGEVRVGDKIRFLQADRKYEVLEIGINNPEETPVDVLKEGQVGMKNSEEAHIGDTVCLDKDTVDPLPGFKPMKAMVYAGVFPMDASEFGRLEEAIERLTLNDRSVTVAKESSAALSQGFRLGFLGTLHMDVFRQRLEDEYSSNVIITAPTVPYRVTRTNGAVVYISNPTEFPDNSDSKSRAKLIEEPMVTATIIVPNEYIGQMMDLCSNYRGTQLEYKVLETSGRSMLKYSFPLSEIVTDFFSALKSASSGFASFDYEEAGYEASDMVKMNILLNGKPVDALAMIVHKSAAQNVGKEWVKKLKEVVPRQLFELAIQAAIGGKVVARESLQANRKDVTAGLYGGHYERKMKQLTKQKEGKKRLKMLAGNIEVPQSAFYEVLSSRPRNFSTSTRTLAPDVLSKEHYEPEILFHAASPPTYRFRAPPASASSSLSADPLATIVNDTSLPPLKPLKLETRKHQPLRPHAVSPVERSKHISTLLRSTSAPPSDMAFADVYSAYIKAYYSSTSGDLLSEAEMSAAISQLYRIQMDRTRGLDRGMVEERVKEVFGHLAKISGIESLDYLETIMTTVSIQALPEVARKDVEEMERHIKDVTRDRHGQDLEAIRGKIQFFLHMLAVSPFDNGRFERYWDQFVTDEGMPVSPVMFIARLNFLDRTKRREKVIPMIQSAVAALKDQSAPLLNASMVFFADQGQWDSVSEIYFALTGRSAPYPLDTPSKTLNLPKGIGSNTRTYSDIIPLLSFSGYIEAGLSVMTDMIAAGYHPSVREYMALLDGFASFGQPDKMSLGDPSIPADLFPPFADIPIGRTRKSHKVMKRRQAGSKSQWARSFAKIWEAGARESSPSSLSSSGHPQTTPESERQHSISDIDRQAYKAWNRETLGPIFEGLMNLKPGTRGVVSPRTAPSPGMVWQTLLGFARVSGGNLNVVREAWETLDGKFSGATGERWVEWRRDRRLDKVVKGLKG